MNETQENSLLAFDEAIKVEYKGNLEGIHLYSGYCNKDWRIGLVQHGGYLISIILNAFTHHFKNVHPHPLHISAHFLNKSMSGPCMIEINDIKPGKNHSIAYAIFKQPKNDDIEEGYIEKIHVTALFGDLNKEGGITQPYFDVIPISNKSDCELFEPNRTISTMDNHIKVLLDTPTKNLKRAEIKQWAKFSDKRRKLDLISLGLFSDLFFPGPPGHIDKEVLKGDFWYPTLTLEIQFKNIPKGQWVVSSFRSRFLQNGRNEVDGELWDEDGNLLCITRHMCLVTSWEKNVGYNKL
ncbi:thioesterase-like superfamily-domain-containing protein [Glomus cerebriforme]|uniref:Thioesterase-like superfamily-domain-containing protein n=1 Tax=Glomus cerebriforme TaxID=658196 RepID=A0A397TIW9_9GLOM|nr:thioesterase-like superfamily-domain-containing protein [Glomus cerebriforme]